VCGKERSGMSNLYEQLGGDDVLGRDACAA
jgi:hypothetical protein